MTKPNTTRYAYVSGQFYPLAEDKLKAKIDGFLSLAKSPVASGSVKAILVPHAGYDYSGPVAAEAYRTIQGKEYNRVIIMSSAHTESVSGAVIDENADWLLPFGRVEVDYDFAKALVDSGEHIDFDVAAHREDHTLEVQVPFLQTVLKPGFKIVPILFGNSQAEPARKEIVDYLKNNLSDNDLIVISTDLSHYPDYEIANEIDPETLSMIRGLDLGDFDKYLRGQEIKLKEIDTLVCSEEAVKTAMSIADLKGWNTEILKYANSGDSPIGRPDHVVGYGAMVFLETRNLKLETYNIENILNKDQQQTLLGIAQETVEEYVRNGEIKDFVIEDERLMVREGAFVTLHKDGELRGCIGQIIPSGDPLWQVVRNMAIEAATDDPRFKPVAGNELQYLDYEISVLSVPKIIDNWQDIELGKHGVIVEKGIFNKGVFLPQVATETGWDLEEFLSQLCSQKAGLAGNAYKNDPKVVLKVFTAQVFS